MYNRWYNVALTLNSTWMAMFIDGVLVSSYTGTLDAAAIQSEGNLPYHIGADPQPKYFYIIFFSKKNSFFSNFSFTLQFYSAMLSIIYLKVDLLTM